MRIALVSILNEAYMNLNPTPESTRSALAGVRIARISTVPFFVVSQLRRQIAMLGEQGALVTVVASEGPEMSLISRIDGVRVFPIDIPRSISLWRDLVALMRLFIFFKRERFEIAHSTTPKAGLLIALAARFSGVPIRVHTFTGQPWVNISGPRRWLARASDKIIGRLNTRCYTDSESQKQFLVQQGIVDAKRLFVIGDGSLAGVDINRFNRERFSQMQCTELRDFLGLPEDAPVLIFVGRVTADKGVRELLQAFQVIKKNGSRAHLVFVGPFDNERATDLTISPNDVTDIPDTHLVGYTDNPEAYFAIADILCLPSYREGFGTVVIEAAAMGVPTVGTNIYGLSDAIVDGETGILVPSRSVFELANAITQLLTDDTLRKKMGAAARRRAVSSFDAAVVNQKVADEYSMLLLEEKKR